MNYELVQQFPVTRRSGYGKGFVTLAVGGVVVSLSDKLRNNGWCSGTLDYQRLTTYHWQILTVDGDGFDLAQILQS